MITIRLYTFEKYENSTKRPTGNGTTFSCKVKSPSSLETPKVELSTAYPGNFNYAYIPEWNRYYFITDCSYDEGLWVLQLKVDVLATYKTEIGNASLYVIRSSAEFDRAVKDEFYPVKAQMQYSSQSEEGFSGYTYDSGYYVINVLGTTTTGNSTLFELTPENYRKLISELYTDINGWQVTDFVQSVVQKFGGNPAELLTSAMYFPLPFATHNNTTEVPIKIGGWTSTTAVGVHLNNPIRYLPGFNPNVNSHPQAALRGDYLSIAPYTKYELYVPGVGIINLDTSELRGVAKIYVTRSVDALTGKMFCLVETDANPTHYLAAVESQWGVPIALKGSNNGGSLISGAISSLGSAAIAAVTGGAAAIIGAVAAGVGTIAGSIGGATSSASAGGSLVNLLEPMRLDTTFYYVTDDDNTHNGRPLMKVRQLSNIPGFIMVQRGDVPIEGTAEEQAEIRRYLEGGFYYE